MLVEIDHQAHQAALIVSHGQGLECWQLAKRANRKLGKGLGKGVRLL